MNWRNMHWRNAFVFRDPRLRNHVARAVAAAIILLGALPAWTQNEGAAAPAPDNVLQASSLQGTFNRWMQPPTAEAAPRNIPRQRVRASAVKKPVEAAAPEPAPPAAPAWPNAEASAGTGEIVPVVVKTVREMAEAETTLVHENELSDLDMMAKPLSAPALATQDETVIGTDGRAIGGDGDFREDRLAAFAETLNSIGHASWLKALLLAMAGAIAAVTAMRIFAQP